MKPNTVARALTLIGMLTFLLLPPGFSRSSVSAVEQGTVTVTKTWAPGQEPNEVVEICFTVSADELGSDMLGESCTTDETYTVVFGPTGPDLQTGVTYWVSEKVELPWEVTGDNPVSVVIPDTTGEAFVTFENQRVDGAFIAVHEFVCLPGFEGDTIGEYYEACHANPRPDVELSASGPGDRFSEATTNQSGIAVFAGYTAAGEITVAESVPTGDFVDYVVGCKRQDTLVDIPIEYRGNGRAAFAIDLEAAVVDGDVGVVCEWYNLVAGEEPTVTVTSTSTPVSLTFTIEPTEGSDGRPVRYEGDGYSPGGDVVVLMTGDGLIVDETTADDDGRISGQFQVPDRDQLTGESTDRIPVFAIDQETGRESPRVTFTYLESPTVTPKPTRTPSITPSPAKTPTPTATPTRVAIAGRPIEIRAGTCEGPGGVSLVSLNDLTLPTSPSIGSDFATVVEASYLVINLSFQELIAGEHSITVHASHAQMQPFVACGEIGGPPRNDGSIVVGLRELNGSGLTGIAYLRPDPTNANRTQISVFLAAGLAEEDPTLDVPPGDGTLIFSVISNGPVSPEFQSSLEITIRADGEFEVVFTPAGASPALAEEDRTADAETRTGELSGDELQSLLLDLNALGYFQLTQIDEVNPDLITVGGKTSRLSVSLIDGTWEIDGNGISADETAVLAEAQQLVSNAVGFERDQLE